MAATTAQVYQLRRLAAEPTDARGYTNTRLAAVIEGYPLPDAAGRRPTDADWSPTYDVNQAAADVWDEKASSLAENYDTAGANRSQAYEHAVRRAKHFRARRSPALIEPTPYPYPTRQSWVGNAAE